ncbi:MAG: hypothetical protein NTV36_00200 [Candidatus Staskawiczbacteria bacterium]|nr:hypothetical protein [Candidatus Staskawiczbacteria bacterium]
MNLAFFDPDLARAILIALAVLCGMIVLFIPIGFLAGILRVVTVREATYVAFTQQGGFVYGAMEFDGYHLEPDGTIVSGPGPKSHGKCKWILRWGGWVFYIWPFVEPAQYANYNDPNDGFGGGIHVRLGDVSSNPFTSVAETTEKAPDGTDAGSVGVSIKFTSKMRVSNGKLFLFKSPRNVIKEAIEDRQGGVLRAWTGNGNVKHAQAVRGNGASLWAELGSYNLLESFEESKRDWGLEIVPKSIIVKDVELDPNYQAALKSESEQGLVARGEAARLSGPVEVAMQDWITRQMEDSNLTTAEDRAKLIAKLKKSGEYHRKEKYLEELRSKALAGSGYTELNIHSQGHPVNPSGLVIGGGNAGLLMGGKGKGGNQGKKGGRKDPRDMDSTERRDAADKL